MLPYIRHVLRLLTKELRYRKVCARWVLHILTPQDGDSVCFAPYKGMKTVIRDFAVPSRKALKNKIKSFGAKRRVCSSMKRVKFDALPERFVIPARVDMW